MYIACDLTNVVIPEARDFQKDASGLLGPHILTAMFDCSFNPSVPKEVMGKVCPFPIVGSEANINSYDLHLAD